MEIKIPDKSEYGKYYDEILQMLIDADEDFVPPLSARNPNDKEDLSSTKKLKDGVLLYFEEVKKEKLMVAIENGKLLGFVTYKENYTCSEIEEKNTPNIYISTLIVKKEARGKHLTQTMYGLLFKKYEMIDIFTRTWSTNAAHIKVLEKFDFNVLKVIENDRGKGIHTVYFVKKGNVKKLY